MYKFVIVRWTDNSILVLPIKKSATENEVLNVLVKFYSEFMNDHQGYDFYDENRRLINTRDVAKAVVQYATEKEEFRFWFIDKDYGSDYLCIGPEDIAPKHYCQNKIRHDFDDVLEMVRVSMRWRRLL